MPTASQSTENVDSDEDEPVAARTRAKATTETTVAAEGCKKSFLVHLGHTSGVLVASRPCNQLINVVELVIPELTHDVLTRLLVLRENNVPVLYSCYDNACHLEQSARKHQLVALAGMVFVIDRFHEVNHKCTAYNADLYPELKDVNTEAAEQLFVWIRRFQYLMLTMNGVRFFFLFWNVCESHNRFLEGKKKAARIVRVEYYDVEEEFDQFYPATWTIRLSLARPEGTLGSFLLRKAAAVHRAMLWAAPQGATAVQQSPFFPARQTPSRRPLTKQMVEGVARAVEATSLERQGPVTSRLKRGPPTPLSSSRSPPHKHMAIAPGAADDGTLLLVFAVRHGKCSGG